MSIFVFAIIVILLSSKIRWKNIFLRLAVHFAVYFAVQLNDKHKMAYIKSQNPILKIILNTDYRTISFILYEPVNAKPQIYLYLMNFCYFYLLLFII